MPQTMFNDTSSLLTHLATRRSGKARDMVAPGPDMSALNAILTLAMRTPDHGKLNPWRFIVIGDHQRDAFASALKRAWVSENPGTAKVDLSALDQFAHQAPSLVVLVSSPVNESKIPVWEQQLSVGAVGMNLLHAAHAHGFVGSWLTGWAAYSQAVLAALELAAGESIGGYFFIGTAANPLSERPRPDAEAITSHWMPPIICD